MHFRNNYDIIVVGAGIAGISAAVKCGKENVKVLLIESYPFLGGMSSAGMVSPFMKHEVNGEILVRGIFEDIEDEMRSMNGMIDNGFYASAFRSSAFNLLSRNNVDIILNASLIGVETNNNFIESVRIVHENKIMNISGKVFIDTTGDAQIIFLAGLPFQKGDEQTGKLQAMTLFFRIGNIDLLQTLKYVKQNKDDFLPWMEFEFDLSKIISVAGFFSNVKKAIAENRLNSDINYIFFTTLPESGEASFNTSNILSLDGSSSFDLTKAELIGRKQVNQVYKILKNEIPGFHNSVLLETAAQVGVRETRRAIGDYIITGDDIRSGKKFNDSVARGCYGIDIHGQKDEDDRMEDLPEGEFYEIPLRSLIVKNIKNLLVAGRCISSTREAHGALRIQPTSAATGEACGAIASVAIKSNLEIRDVNYLEVQKLIKHNIGSK
jgi:hypothetical protein